jgi:hypothetical protein
MKKLLIDYNWYIIDFGDFQILFFILDILIKFHHVHNEAALYHPYIWLYGYLVWEAPY